MEMATTERHQLSYGAKKEHHLPCQIYLTHLTDLCAKYSAQDRFSWSLLASQKILKPDCSAFLFLSELDSG